MDAVIDTATDKKQVRLKVMTPTRVIYDESVDFFIVRASEGDMGIKYGHEPCTALLDYGSLRIFNDNTESEIFTVLGGIVTVVGNEAVILSEMAEHPEKLQETIDKIRDERAANRLKEQTADLDMYRAQMAIRRALVHLDVSAYSVIKDHVGKD